MLLDQKLKDSKINYITQELFEKYKSQSKPRERKKFGWAIRNDVIFIILFVLISAAWYKAVIQGAYWGEAMHVVGEAFNESYNYYSSDDDTEENINS